MNRKLVGMGAVLAALFANGVAQATDVGSPVNIPLNVTPVPDPSTAVLEGTLISAGTQDLESDGSVQTLGGNIGFSVPGLNAGSSCQLEISATDHTKVTPASPFKLTQAGTEDAITYALTAKGTVSSQGVLESPIANGTYADRRQPFDIKADRYDGTPQVCKVNLTALEVKLDPITFTTTGIFTGYLNIKASYSNVPAP